MRIQLNHEELLVMFPHLCNLVRTENSLIDALKIVEINCRNYAILHINISHTPVEITYDMIFMPLILVKSKEELAAEESVKKAEEALKAAKDVLGKIKEK